MRKLFGGRSALALAVVAIAYATGAQVASAGQPLDGALGGVDRVLEDVTGNVQRGTGQVLGGSGGGAQRAPAVRSRGATPGSPGGYQPPLHGTNPHGQGTVITGDLAPTGQRPLSGNPSGGQPQPQNNEEIVVGRARGEKDGSGYHGHITIAALLGNELVGVDTRPGQSASGPLEAVQQAVLDSLCNGSGNQICLEVLQADSTTTSSSTTNRFAVARARVGGDSGIGAGVAESTGNASEDANCQSSSGSASVANANVGTGVRAAAANSASSSRSCRDGSGSQSNSSQVIGLNGTGVPLPAAGCGAGTPDTVTGLPPLAPIVCNADDVNGAGETLTQAAQRYGVREALTVFALDTGGTALLRANTSASESRSQAPSGPGDGGDGGNGGDDDVGPDDDGAGNIPAGASAPGAGAGAGPGSAAAGPGDRSASGAPECADGVDNDGDGRVDFPNDPGCESRSDDSEANELAFTGLNVALMLVFGSLAVALGLRLHTASDRRATV